MKRLLLLCAAASALWVSDAAAICRIVEEPDSPPPIIEPSQPVLIIKHRDVVVGEDCPAVPDGGVRDAGSVVDAGADAGPDASPDAGPGDAADPDAGPPPQSPECMEIVGDAITIVTQPRFRTGADGSHFALLMVTPQRPIITIEDQDLFKQLAIETAPRVDEIPRYVEDESLGYQCNDPKWNSEPVGCGYSGGGGGFVPPNPPPGDYPDPDDAVDVQTIGAYEVARLSLSTEDDLAAWLDDNGYLYTDADLEAAAPYIEDGWTVIAVRVATDERLDGGLEPLAFTYPGSEVRLPTGISRQPPPAEARLTVYIAAEGRYDLPGAYIQYAERSWSDGSFLTRNNLVVDLSLGSEGDPVAARVAGDPTYRDVVTVDQVVRIPSSNCPGGKDDAGCWCRTGGGPGPGSLVLFGICALALLRRRR